MTNPTNPQGAAGGVKGSGGSFVDESVHNGREPQGSSPWAREPNPPSATETTSSLPAVEADPDPFTSKPVPAAVKPEQSAPKLPLTRTVPSSRPAPMNAVDQYAALSAPPLGSVGRSVPAPVPPGPPRPAAPLPPAMPLDPAAPGAPSATVKAAKAIRRPKVARSPRRAKLQLRHLNVWSVLRFSCVLAIALFFVWLIMVGVLYGVLDVTHVFTKINDTVRTINGDNTKNVITPGIVFGAAFIIGLVNIVLFIALSTIGSIVYNLCADLVGGIEVTLAEHE